MPISHKNKLIFLHIPKNAGTSITDTEGITFDYIGHHFPDFYKNNFSYEWDNYTKFGVVRNPWDRVVSNYEYGRMAESHWHSVSGKSKYGPHPDYKHLSNLTFKETLHIFNSKRDFLKHQGWEVQHPYVYDKDGILLLDHVFKLDKVNTHEGFKKLIPNLTHKNKTNKKYNSYRDYYDDETIKIVGEIYAKDIELFKFEF